MTSITRRAAGQSAPICLFFALVLSGSAAQAEGDQPDGAASESAAAAPSSEADMAEARLHFENGVELLTGNAPNYQDAYRQFQLAYEKSGGNWKVLGNLGLCALKLERDGEALDHYTRYLDEGGKEIDPQETKSIRKELLLLKGNMGTVTVKTSEATARLRVERQGSSAPAQVYEVENGEATLGLRSGQLRVKAITNKGEQEWDFVLSAEQTAEHIFDFNEKPKAEAAAAPAAAVSAAPQDEPKKSNPLVTAGWITAGVGAGVLAGGLVTGILKNNKEGKAFDEECVDDPSVDGGLVCTSEGDNLLTDAESLATITNALLISGGVLAASGVTLIVIGKTGGSKEKPVAKVGIDHLEFKPLVSWGFAGVGASGRF